MICQPNAARCTETPRRALGSARDPMRRSRHQMVGSSGEMRNAPRERKTAMTKVKTRKLWSSPRMQITIPCVPVAICLERKTRAETAAPWRPDARCKQLWPRLGWVRLCADYRLPPPPASPIISESITARLSQQHTGRLDWQQGRTFALFLHCKNALSGTESHLKSVRALSGENKMLQESVIKHECAQKLDKFK